MIFYMLFAPYLCYFGLYDIYYNNFDKLDDLGCSELQKSLVKWMINNFFVLLYFLNQFHRPWMLNDQNFLKYGSIGVALTTVWIPVVKRKMSVFLGFYGLYDFFFYSNTKLDDLGCSEPQKLLFNSTIKSILFLVYFIDQNRAPWLISNETMLFYGVTGYGLIQLWLPLLNAYQLTSLCLMTLQTLFLVVGTLHTIKLAVLYRNIPKTFLFWEFRIAMVPYYGHIIMQIIRFYFFHTPDLESTLPGHMVSHFFPKSRYGLVNPICLNCMGTAAVVYSRQVNGPFPHPWFD